MIDLRSYVHAVGGWVASFKAEAPYARECLGCCDEGLSAYTTAFNPVKCKTHLRPKRVMVEGELTKVKGSLAELEADRETVSQGQQGGMEVGCESHPVVGLNCYRKRSSISDVSRSEVLRAGTLLGDLPEVR